MKYYSLTEVSKLLHVSRPTVFRWIQQGKLKAIQEEQGIGRKEYKIPESEVNTNLLPVTNVTNVTNVMRHETNETNVTNETIATNVMRNSSDLPVTSVTNVIMNEINVTRDVLREILEEIKRIYQIQNEILNELRTKRDETIATNVMRHETNVTNETIATIATNVTKNETIVTTEPQAASETNVMRHETIVITQVEKIDWVSIRERLRNEAKERGGNRAMARFSGIAESVIRRFIKGESKTLNAENMGKLKQAWKAGEAHG